MLINNAVSSIFTIALFVRKIMMFRVELISRIMTSMVMWSAEE